MVVLKHNSYRQIVATIKQGGVLIFPTDTVWGLGGNALNPQVKTQIYQIKQRPTNQPFIWLLPTVAAVMKYCGAVTPAEKKLLRQKRTSVIINGQAVRVIKNGWLHRLLQRCQVPLIATSANHHGQPTITSWHQAVTTFGDQVTAIVKGRRLAKLQPSTIVQIIDQQPHIYRA